MPRDGLPNVVQNCTFTGLGGGIRLAGLDDGKSRNPKPCRGIVIRNNRVFDCVTGIWAAGVLKDVHIVGNRVWGWAENGIELSALLEGTSDLLIANNTLQGQHRCLQVLEPDGSAGGVEICNNLVLAEHGPDLAFTGKDRQPLKVWRIHHNWRQVPPPATGTVAAKEWLLSSEDKHVSRIELKSNKPQDPEFMRPPKSSPLAVGGAGGSLPSYVGAVPPEGVTLWDWDRTWREKTKKGSGKQAE